MQLIGKESVLEEFIEVCDFSDTSVGYYFAKFVDGAVYYCPDTRSWFCYNGAKWESSLSEGDIYKLYIEFISKTLSKLDEIPRTSNNADGLFKATKNFLLFKNANKVENIIRLFKKNKSTQLRMSDFNNNVHLLNVKNGIIDLNTLSFTEPNREIKNLNVADVNYNPNADCPEWEKFLNVVTEGDQGYIRVLQEIIGYTLLPEKDKNFVFFMFGDGANGKSTFIKVLSRILGDYAATTDPDILLSTDTNSVRQYSIAALQGKRFINAPETHSTQLLDEASLKRLSGSDDITARHPYGRPFEFKAEFKLFIHGNYKPIIRGDDKGIWRRLVLLPFTALIPDSQIDHNIFYKLIKEDSGILNWMLEGVKLVKLPGSHINRERFDCKKMENEMSDYKEESDQIGRFFKFLSPNSQITEDKLATIGNLSQIRKKYEEWCMEASEPKISIRQYNKRIEAHGFERKQVWDGKTTVHRWVRKHKKFYEKL